MKKRLSAGILLFLSLASSAWAKSYGIEELVINSRILSDGSLEVTERIRYDFRGSYSFAFREIPLRGAERLTGITVSEAQSQYRRGSEEVPGSFSVDDRDGRVKITWHYEARDEKRTFELSYRLQGVIHRHPDFSELYYKFVGEEWDRSIDRVAVTVQLPEEVPTGSIRAWAHGPLQGTVSLPGDGTVRLDVAPLPARSFWEARIVFPMGTAALPVESGSPEFERILSEEAAWAEGANRRRMAESELARRRSELQVQLLPLVVLAPLVGIGIWTYLYLRFGRPYPKQYEVVQGERPSSHPPALVLYLLHRNVDGRALVATLIDLARRGCLSIREEVRETRGWFGKKEKRLAQERLSRPPAQWWSLESNNS